MYDWESDWSDSTFFCRHLTPGVVCELRINGHANDLNIGVLELHHTVVVRNDFCWADECKIQRPEE